MNNTRQYKKYLHSFEWKAKREEAFRVHGRKCKNCGATERLEVNHKHYRNIFNENVADDLEILCHYCHCIHHGASKFKMRRQASKSKKRRSKKWAKVFAEPGGTTMEEYRQQGQHHRSTMLK